MESLQAMKLGKMNDMLNVKETKPVSKQTRHKSTKLVEKAFANLFINDVPRKRSNSVKGSLKSNKKPSFEMNELKITSTTLKEMEEKIQFEDSVVEPEPVLDNIKCPCLNSHPGKEMLNIIIPNLNVNQLYDSLFTKSEFLIENWKIRKVFDVKLNDWELKEDSTTLRMLEYKIDLGAIGKPINYEYQKMLTNKPNECYCIESNVKTQGVLYCEYFSVVNRYCMTRHDSNSSHLIISSFINFNKNPNFIAKTFIERNCNSNLKEYYEYLSINLPKYMPSGSEMNQPDANINSVTPKKIKKDHKPKVKNLTVNLNSPNLNEQSNNKSICQIKNSFFSFSIRYDVLFIFLFLLIFVSIILDIGMFLKLIEAENIINKHISFYLKGHSKLA